jgi:hypothetical protein
MRFKVNQDPKEYSVEEGRRGFSSIIQLRSIPLAKLVRLGKWLKV